MNTIGVIGAGTMGSGITHVAARAGFSVRLYDVVPASVQNALTTISAQLQRTVEKGELSATQVPEIISKIFPADSLKEFSDCELVIEAAAEDLKIKQTIFQQLESVCSPETILATNTSSLSITAIASTLNHPERVVGLHFFNPAHLMKLVEVVRGNHTSQEVFQKSAAFVNQLKKTSVVVHDTPGFIVNRCARPFYGEALRLLSEGVASVEEIDRIVKLEGGFKMGPFELMDLIGIDVNFAVTKSLYEQTFGEPRYRPSIIQERMVAAGRLGRKTKRGFYTYEP
jgi:3-hydroxybutyryl-CoA dehydrogenase